MQTLCALMIQLLFFLPAHAESGMASVYTRAEGKWTASGEHMSNDTLTAAHRTLPLGTLVRVHFGHKVAIVRINDRGPWVKHRILDLTPRAARVLGIDGLGFVRLDPIK